MAETTNGACRTRACPVQRANNSYGKGGEEATEGEIVAALELGNAHRFISSVQHIMSNPDLMNMATESMKNMRLQDLKQVGNLEQYDIAQQRREKLIKKPAAKKAASTAKKAPPAAKKAASSSESSEEDSYEESEDNKSAQKTAKADTKTADITLC